MRLFYAVNFNDNVKKVLSESLKEIKKYTVKGSFTDKENFHMTLVFVGECDSQELPDLKKVADKTVKKLKLKPIKTAIDRLGTFSRPGDELLWAGVTTDPKDILYQMNKLIVEELDEYGLLLNDGKNKFKPHITIARKVEFNGITGKEIQQMKFVPINFIINSLTLMESTQGVKTHGYQKYNAIIYKPIYEVKF